MISREWLRVGPLMLAVVLGACAGAPAMSPSPPAAVRIDFAAIEAKLKRNTTNQLHVHTLLGAPHAVGASVDTTGVRYEEWLYYLGTNGAPRARRDGAATLEIKFDRQGIVRAYRWLEPKAP